MSTQSSNRRSSFSSSTTSSLAKRHASSSSSENVGKVTASLAKKRVPLSNITNQKNSSRSSVSASSLVPCSNKILKARKTQPVSNVGFSGHVLPSTNVRPSSVLPPKVVTSFPRGNEVVVPPPSISTIPPPLCSMEFSPSKSDGVSVSMDETMSTCDSFKSPEVEYMDNRDVTAIDSIERKTFSNLYISDHLEATGNICNRDAIAEMETDDKIIDVDDNYVDPQFCATFACDIYKHLRASEVKKRPSTDFMERIQKDINSSMRAILIDWLVEVAEEYRLVPDTLYLTVNYIDRYLSGNVMNRQRLQLLGVACMMIAAKYEEICAPQVEEFCYITDNTYFKEEVLEMESSVLNYLKFEMTAATAKCFLRRFVRAAQGVNEVPSMQLECMANYIAELSLLEYTMLCYAPSLIAASAIFLAKFILLPSKRPWNSTLQHYTLYKPSDLCDCVKDLHRLCCNNQNSTLPAIREKYNQHKYKCVAKKYCPPSIPSEFFQN
ncbi:Cyclin A1,1 isoform 1 [Theobroma cacao]|uniref:Cyclin A1,1 isoform 1 n=1 Tax=Theobroma cacao TaxID=3641 RepID=A0A061FI58_THECC|nr:Cyclin A1,1 isoform 1 [Theobroma cacao]